MSFENVCILNASSSLEIRFATVLLCSKTYAFTSFTKIWFLYMIFCLHVFIYIYKYVCIYVPLMCLMSVEVRVGMGSLHMVVSLCVGAGN